MNNIQIYLKIDSLLDHKLFSCCSYTTMIECYDLTFHSHTDYTPILSESLKSVLKTLNIRDIV